MVDFERLLGKTTRVRGVIGVVVVDAEDGLVVAESIMEGIRVNAIAALTANMFSRVAQASDAAGKGKPAFLQMQSEEGVLVAMPDNRGLLLVVVGDVNTNVGLVKMELMKVANSR